MRQQLTWTRLLPSPVVQNIATLGPLGFLGKAPGTLGSIAGMLWFTTMFLHLSLVGFLIFLSFTVYLATEICGEAEDTAQGTGFTPLNHSTGTDNDQGVSGEMWLFSPSSTTYVKHFISRNHSYNASDYADDSFMAGYGNTTSAVDAVQFKFSSGNIDAGTIKLYGII